MPIGSRENTPNAQYSVLGSNSDVFNGFVTTILMIHNLQNYTTLYAS